MTDTEKLDDILMQLKVVSERLDRIEKSCSGMDSHIDFVDGVYGTLRSPLDFIANKVNRLSGAPTKTLPPSTTSSVQLVNRT